MTSLAKEVEKGGPEAISESRSSLRGLLRDFRDKGRHYVHQLESEMGLTAQALERLIDSVSQYDGDHESRLRQALKAIRDLAQDPAAAPVAHVLRAVGDTINQAAEQYPAAATTDDFPSLWGRSASFISGSTASSRKPP